MFNQRRDVEIQWKIKISVWVVIFIWFMLLQEGRLFEIKSKRERFFDSFNNFEWLKNRKDNY